MKYFLILMISLFLFSNLYSLDLPEPMTGFKWVEYNELNGAFLTPIEWYIKKENSKGTLALFSSKENIDIAGVFVTGYSLNCVKNVDKKTGQPASKFAQALKNQTLSVKKLITQWDKKVGIFILNGYIYESNLENGTKINVANLLISNDKTGTLYFNVFEAPAENWEEEWKKGSIIFENLVLDDEI